METGVIRYPLRTWPFWLNGLFFGGFALFTAGPVYTIAVYDTLFHPVNLLLVVTVFGFAALAIYALGLAIMKPVGLRVDAQGVSGYFAPNLTWDEIERIELLSYNRGTRVGIILKDPDGYLDRLQFWGRVRYALRHRPYHTVINTTHLRSCVTDVVAEMRRHLA